LFFLSSSSSSSTGEAEEVVLELSVQKFLEYLPFGFVA
jgi:hypothetical protein